MKSIVLLLSLTFCLLLTIPAFSAETTPIQLSFFNPIQLFSEETKVQGLRLNFLYGVNKEMTGIDLGVVNQTNGPTQGLQLGLFPFGGFNITNELEGVQFAGFFGGANSANGNVSGIQVAGALAGFNKAENLNGIQIAGILLGVNLAKNTKGIQIATLYNQAEEINGLQVGIVNVAKSLHGVQIGLANIVKDSSPIFLPIINARF